MTVASTAAASRIRALNDQLRRTGTGGTIVATAGLQSLGRATMARIVTALRDFDDFSTDNDPHGEHDFGAFEVDEHRIFFKVDYFGNDLCNGSPDPADPALTRRVITVMLAHEY